jgi:hypothetical protein
MRRRIAIVAALVPLVAAALAVESAAHDVKYETIAEIQGVTTAPPFTILGVVGSFDENQCTKKRKVTVWKENPGGVMDAPLGTTKSDGKGEWTLVLGSPAGAGDFFATVKKKTLKRSSEHKHVCKADRSPIFGVPAG